MAKKKSGGTGVYWIGAAIGVIAGLLLVSSQSASAASSGSSAPSSGSQSPPNQSLPGGNQSPLENVPSPGGPPVVFTPGPAAGG